MVGGLVIFIYTKARACKAKPKANKFGLKAKDLHALNWVMISNVFRHCHCIGL